MDAVSYLIIVVGETVSNNLGNDPSWTLLHEIFVNEIQACRTPLSGLMDQATFGG